jgi:hypothetical protein
MARPNTSPSIDMDNQFAFTTRQAARVIGVTTEAMRAQLRRTGSFRGITPTRLPNSHLLWPRAATLRLAGKTEADRRTAIDLRATMPWLDSRNLLTSDPMVEAIAIALCDPRDDTKREAQCNLDDLHALRHWVQAQISRLTACRPRLTSEQVTDAYRLLALAIAPAVIKLPEDVLHRAVADMLEGVAA